MKNVEDKTHNYSNQMKKFSSKITVFIVCMTTSDSTWLFVRKFPIHM